MRYADLPRLLAPAKVTRGQHAVATIPPTLAATAGATWGKPSAFEWSIEAARAGGAPGGSSPGVTIDYPEDEPPELMRIIDAELNVNAERVKVRDPGNSDIWVEIDRITRMGFHYTEFLPKPDPSALQPSLTTYYDLSFALHPPASEES